MTRPDISWVEMVRRAAHAAPPLTPAQRELIGRLRPPASQIPTERKAA